MPGGLIGPGAALPPIGVVRISMDESFGCEGSAHKGWGILSTMRVGKRLSLGARHFAIGNDKSWSPVLCRWDGWPSPISEEWEGRGIVKDIIWNHIKSVGTLF